MIVALVLDNTITKISCTDCSDFATVLGGYIEFLGDSPKGFDFYVKEEGMETDANNLNHLAVPLMNALGLNIRMEVVYGPLLITGKDETGLTEEQFTKIVQTAED